MKKIIISFIALFLATGCYDYTELNNIAIISGISIDYEDDKYHIAAEILNTKGPDEEITTEEKVYIAKGIGKTITEAFYDLSKEIYKNPYYAHVKIVIIDENIAKEHLEEISDFLMRENSIRNIFQLVVAKERRAEEVLQSSSKNDPVVSNAIKSLLDNKTFVNNIASDLTYEQFMEFVLDKNSDGYLSSILVEDGIIKLGPIALFSNYKMTNYLDLDDSSTFNILNNNSKENYFQISCPDENDKYIILGAYDSAKTEVKISSNIVNFKTKIEMRVIENHCNTNFREEKTYENLQKSLNKKIESDMNKTVNNLIKNNSDILRIGHKYYQKYKKNIDFRKLFYDYSCEVLIDKNGLIFEVRNNE